MDRSICLALDVDADAATVFQAVSTTAGQRAFWTADCEVEANRARFGFAVAPVDRMSVLALSRTSWSACTSPPGFPSWEGSTWEWEIGGSGRSETGTGVLFRHDGFGDGYAETRPRLHGAHLGDDPGPAVPVRDQWTPQPYFPETPA